MKLINIKLPVFGIVIFSISIFFLALAGTIKAYEICQGYVGECTYDYQCGSLPGCQTASCIGTSVRYDWWWEYCSCEYEPEKCVDTCESSADTCKCILHDYYCIVPGQCYYSNCSWETCREWSGWSACSGGWQYRTCMDGSWSIDWATCSSGGNGDTSPPSTTPPTLNCAVSLSPSDLSISQYSSRPLSDWI